MPAMAVFFALLLAAERVQAAPIPDAPVLIYTNVCYVTESGAGDVIGAEIILMRLPGETRVHYRLAEGDWMKPVLVDANVNEKTGEITFSVPDEGGPIAFKGNIAGQTLTGVFHRDAQGMNTLMPYQVRLKRVMAASYSVPDCYR